MILRRVGKHVRKQEWTAIAIDFVIVVIGAFVGLQANNLNESRRNVREEHALIVRLAEEFNVLAGLLGDRIDRAQRWAESTGELIMPVGSDGDPVDEARVKVMLRNALWYSAPIPPPTTFSDVIQSGQIVSTRNDNLR